MEKEGATAASGVSPTGTIRLEVDKVSTLDHNGRYSPEIEVGGLNWRSRALKNMHSGDPQLYLCLDCFNSQSTLWKIAVELELIIFHSDRSKNVKKLAPATYSADYDYWGVNLLKWDDLMDEGKGFTKDDKIIVEIRFSIVSMKGIKFLPRIDFTDPNETCHDVTLVIDGEKIYASKQHLSLHSAVFKAMFYGNFEEKNKKEIEIKDVDRVEFLEMLHVIYPSFKKIKDYSAEYLLKLGDRFQIACVIERVEEFLISTSKVPNSDKLRIADQYRLFGLQEHCLSELKTMQDFKDIKESVVYRNLSDDTKDALFERLLKLAKIE